ncbi:hypothetical protein FPOA_09423 [Fusarium poae]|uniref:WSC domain-containing protein n=1 Tax=Fusarium poae TaxID=36050 RepID=A0A1B8AB34_FUSPO|nr:hypothetical protein FPOA_09423 [Fusarium poae]
MRFTPGLLLALASSVTAQRFTNSSIPATGSATESATGTTTELAPTSSAGPPQPVDLGNAVLGPGASFATFPDGSVAISLRAGPNGVASFAVGGAFPFGIDIGDLIQILFDILVELLSDSRKRADGGCTLDVTVDGVSVFTEGLETTGGVVSRSSSGTPAGESAPQLEFIQSCGANPSALTVGNVKVAADDGTGGGGGNGGGNGGNTDTETGTAIVTETTLTNSEGEPTATVTDTIIPTDTEINTNSEGATTNSEGETIVPTGTETATETNTNSEGATTNSEGETITATGTETAPTSTGTSAAGFPASIDNFVLFGCVGSDNGFPTFELAQSSSSMDLDQCATLCVGRSYFGVYDTDCYCGDEVDDGTERVNLDSCDIECPGDDSEFCGGDAPLARRSRFSRRQSAIPNTILLTVYVNLGGADVTLTNVLTATVTDQSTITTTFTTTIEGASTTQTQTVTAIYECYNGQCYPDTGKGGRIVYIFKPYPGEDCDGQYVYISEACSCKGGSQYVPKYCSNGDCHGLTVYKPEQCDDWYNYDVCYTPADCESCEHGQVIYKPWENTYGTPDHPKVPELPVCSSSHCPDTEHGSKPAPPCYGDNCEESGSKPAPPCTGDHCEESGSKPAPPSGGSDSGSKPAPPSGGSDSGSKPAPPSGGSDSGSKPAPPSGGESDSGSKGSSGGESSGEAPCSGDHCEPTIVSSAGKQAVGGLALLAAVAAALL